MNIDINPYAVAGLRRVDMPHTLKKTTSEDIIDATCRHFEVDIEDVKSRCRKRTIVYPRQVAIYLITQHTDLYLNQIVELFNDALSDHTTIIHSRDVIKQRLSVNDGNVRQDIKEVYDLATNIYVIGKQKNVLQDF